MNHGSGCRGWESGERWCDLDSCGGVTGASVAALACVAVAAGLPPVQVMIMDPLRWALELWVWHFQDSCGGCGVK